MGASGVKAANMGLKDELVVLNDPDEEEEEDEDEEDLVDPQDVLKEECSQKSECVALQEELNRCNERVAGKSNTTEDCAQELYDFVHCVDHCVAHTLFSKLK